MRQHLTNNGSNVMQMKGVLSLTGEEVNKYMNMIKNTNVVDYWIFDEFVNEERSRM